MNKRVNEWFEEVIDGEKVFGIRHIPSGLCAIFDYDEEARNRIIEESKQRKKQLTPHSVKKGHCRTLEFGKSRHGFCTVSLATVLYAYYNNLELSKLLGSGNQIRHYNSSELPENYEDCRSKSLYSTADIVMETDSRKITLVADGRYIKLELKAYNVTEYLSNVPGMLQIIGKPNNMGFLYNGERVQAQLYHPTMGNGAKPYLSTIAYAVYNMGLNEQNFYELLPKIMAEIKKSKKEIDHLNSDRHNHCKWNLSLVPGSLNGSKHNFAARLKLPYFLYMAVTDNGEYRIMFGYQNYARMGQVLHILCPNIHSLNSFLRSIMDIKKAPAFMKHYCTPKWFWGLDKKAPYASLSFDDAARMAEQLIRMDREKFGIWTTETKIVTQRRIGA